MNDTRMPPAADQFMPQLDGLRAIAVGAVLVHHLIDGQYLPGFVSALPLGLGGVRLFFVLSGFLITGILVRLRDGLEASGTRRTLALRQFYARRFLRIFPLYYLVIAIAAIVNLSPVRAEFWWLTSYLYNWRVAQLGWFQENIAHFWSLAVEEQFYLFWPWVVLFAPKRWLTPLAIVMVACGPVSRYIVVLLEMWGPQSYVITPSCFDALGLGALLAIAAKGGPASEKQVSFLFRSALPVGLLMIVLLETIPDIGRTHMVLYDTGTSLVFTWVVAAGSRGFAGPAGTFLTLGPVAYAGRIAYGLYVYHALILQPLYSLGTRLGMQWVYRGPTFFWVACLATLALASLSWHFFERPLNDLKRHFPYRFSRTTPASVAAVV